MKTTKWNIYDHLKTEEEIDSFIEASIEEAKNDIDPKFLIQALETAARTRGMLKTANEADVLGYRLTLVM